jgi:hypothetical protein
MATPVSGRVGLMLTPSFSKEEGVENIAPREMDFQMDYGRNWQGGHWQWGYVNPQMVTNSILEHGFPIWEFLNPPARLHMGIAIWKWGIHRGKQSHLGIFLTIPKERGGNYLLSQEVAGKLPIHHTRKKGNFWQIFWLRFFYTSVWSHTSCVLAHWLTL